MYKLIMKKLLLSGICMAVLAMTGCGTQGGALSQIGTQVLSDVLLGTSGSGSSSEGTSGALGNILSSVLGGSSKPTMAQLIGTWKYYQPGCAFTSDKLLAQAGGEVVAAEIKAKLQPTYDKIGIKSSNTSVTFKEDGTYSMTVAGKTFSGNFTLDESTSKVTMKGMLLTINAYAKRNSNGIALLFESSKLLTLLQTLSALSGNSSIQAVGEVSKSYDGLRLGFDFKK